MGSSTTVIGTAGVGLDNNSILCSGRWVHCEIQGVDGCPLIQWLSTVLNALNGNKKKKGNSFIKLTLTNAEKIA